MEVEVRAEGPGQAGVDAVAVGFAEGQPLPPELAAAPGADDARSGYRKLAILRPDEPSRAFVIGLGAGSEIDAERLRVAGALVAKHACEHEVRSLAWVLPDGVDAKVGAGALTEGAVLASYRFDRYRSREGAGESPPAPALERLVLLSSDEQAVAGAELEARAALVAAGAANRARELQDLPSNALTPAALAERAQRLAAEHDTVTVEVLDREAIAAAGLGGLVAVSQGSATEPRLIALRYRGGGGGKTLGLVGKAVTFDSGGISIKQAGGMHEMKMDMTGGAAVLEALAAIAELGLTLEIAAVVPATENMPSGGSIKPGDVITQLNGKTVEVDNTDAEGRLILADALTWCVREMGAERLVDVATLTGAVVVALGSTYAALVSNDDEWAATVAAAASESGELVWRLPLHPEYKELMKGRIADLTNASAKRKAGTITAASFLEEFVDGVPWAHLDIAGTSWDTGRTPFGKGPTGCGVRLLVRLARDLESAGNR
jgi:leucyl aminopeptidase